MLLLKNNQLMQQKILLQNFITEEKFINQKVRL